MTKKKGKLSMNNPFQTTTVKKKAIDAAHTAQATVQKAKHRVQEILD